MELLATFAEHAFAPDRRLGAPAFRRSRCARRETPRGPGEFAGLGQARLSGECAVTRATIGHSAAKGARVDFDAGGIATPTVGSANQFGNSRRADTASRAGV